MNNINFNTFSCSHSKIVNGELFPCGKCINCRKKRITDWANRMKLEYWSQGCRGLFVTLTYKSQYCPADYTLKMEDAQKFLKRFRKIINLNNGYYGTFLRKNENNKSLQLKCFYCGEYGSTGDRPHYHFIFFGLPFEERVISDILRAWSVCKYRDEFVGYYTKDTKLHKKGDKKYKRVKYYDCMCLPEKASDFQKLRPENFFYVAKYSVKSLNRSWLGVPEFVNMSRRTAIGKEYIDNNYMSILANQMMLEDGDYKFRCPDFIKRYYKDIIDKNKKVIYNIVCREPVNFKDMYSYFINKFKGDRLYNFLNERFEFRYVTPRELLDIHDRNVRREIDYCFKNRKSMLVYYDNNKKYFEAVQLAKKLVTYRYVNNSTGEIKKEVKGTAFVRRFVDYVDFYKLYNSFKSENKILYWRSYGYL